MLARTRNMGGACPSHHVCHVLHTWVLGPTCTASRPSRQLLRLSRELPHRAHGPAGAAHRHPGALPRHPPAAHRRRRAARGGEAGDLPRLPAGRPHVGGPELGDHPLAPIIITRDEPHAPPPAPASARRRRRRDDGRRHDYLAMGSLSAVPLHSRRTRAAGGYDAPRPVAAAQAVSHDSTLRAVEC